MSEFMTILDKFGFPVAIAVVFIIFMIKYINKTQSENIEREKRLQAENVARENRLIDMLNTYAETLEKYATMLDVHGKELSNITKVLEIMQRDICVLKKD